MTFAAARIREWSRRFRKAPLAREVVTGLHNRSAEIWRRTFDLLQRESPEYRNAVDEEFTTESKSHCGELLTAIIAIATGRAAKPAADPFAFVRNHAEWRARHQVPLTASLHAYRLAHKTYWGITRESLLGHSGREDALLSLTMLSDFWIEFFDYIGAVLAEAHSVEEALNAAHHARSYAGLIDDLLRGLEPRDAEARRLRALSGIRQGAPIAVALARPFPSGNENHIDLEVTLRSLVRLIHQLPLSSSSGRLVGIRDGEVATIVCSAADTARGFVKSLRRHRLAAAVGVSRDTAEIARLPESLKEARLALELATASHPVMLFTDIDLIDLLIRRADATALRLIPESARDLPHDLSRTVRAFADCSLNVKQTARRLGVHSNTIYFRLKRVHALTGIDPRTFSGAQLLLTALRLLETHGSGT